MKLYKYRSLTNLWNTLDIIINNRLYCAKWNELNDPLEGRYEIYLSDERQAHAARLIADIETYRNEYRIGSLTADPENFLMWSHYADGHKGVALEIEIPENDPALHKVNYSPFNVIFTDDIKNSADLRHLFTGKSEEWSYEEEYRLITNQEYFNLPERVNRILLGPLVPESREIILRNLLPEIEITRMEIRPVRGMLAVCQPSDD